MTNEEARVILAAFVRGEVPTGDVARACEVALEALSRDEVQWQALLAEIEAHGLRVETITRVWKERGDAQQA